MNENQPVIKEITKCPVCGSTERFVADLARKEGLENAEMYGLNCRPGPQGPQGFMGPVIDEKKMAAALIGHKFPLYIAPIDACGKCGLVYTFKQEVHIAKKMLPPATPPGGRGSPIIPPFGPGKGLT